MICKRVIDLDDITFISGNSESLVFELSDELGRPYDLTEYDCYFYLGGYGPRTGAPLVTKIGEKIECAGNNQFRVHLDSPDTKNIEGKYTYQISVSWNGAPDNTFEVGQGKFIIVHNINH